MKNSRELSAVASELNEKLTRAKERLRLMEITAQKILKSEENARQEIEITTKALDIVTKLGETIQRDVSIRLASIASNALATVFPNPYKIILDIAPGSRGTVDAIISFSRDDQTFRPVLPSGQLVAGGGPVEVAAWGLRPALWAQQSPRMRPVFFLDEPFRFLEEGLRGKVAEILTKLSERLGIQFIIVTHLSELAENAENVIEIGRG